MHGTEASQKHPLHHRLSHKDPQNPWYSLDTCLGSLEPAFLRKHEDGVVGGCLGSSFG